MALTLAKLADKLGGKLFGDGDVRITGTGTLRDAQPGQITFVDDGRLTTLADQSRAAAFLVSAGVRIEGRPCIEVASVRAAFAQVVRHFRPRPRDSHHGISPQASIASSARLGVNVTIHPQAFVGDDVQLGDGCVVHAGARILSGCRLAQDVQVFPGAVVYPQTVIGRRVLIHANAVIGCYGFGYESVGGRHQRSPQLGYVMIGDDVEIGAGTTIDRGTFDATVIGDGTKIDNQVMIGHNCRIGKHNLLCSQVGIAGSVTTGDYVVMAGQVGVRDHVTICDHVTLGARSGVGSDITQPGTYFGAPARPDKQQLQILLAQQKVPDMRREIKDLQQQLARLQSLATKGQSDAA